MRLDDRIDTGVFDGAKVHLQPLQSAQHHLTERETTFNNGGAVVPQLRPGFGEADRYRTRMQDDSQCRIGDDRFHLKPGQRLNVRLASHADPYPASERFLPAFLAR